LTACSTADLSADVMKQRDIPFVCFHYQDGDQSFDDDLGQSVTFDEFYDKMAKGATPKTSQPSTGDYINLWEPIMAAGNDILHLTLSSGISGAYQNAVLAQNEMRSRYPERRIEVVDSLGASSGYGLLVEEVADLRDSGATLDEAKEAAEALRTRIHHWFFSTDLTAYVRGGRVSAPSAWVATKLSICPVLNVDREGKLIPRKKIRTKRNSIKELVKQMEDHATDSVLYDGRCEISNSACPEDAAELVAEIEKKFPNLAGKIVVNSIGTVIGSHTGPGTVALFFIGDERED
jgi:DegV family protein with EDD domain